MEPEVAQRIAELERQLAEAMAAAQAEERGSAQSAEALGRIVELTIRAGPDPARPTRNRFPASR